MTDLRALALIATGALFSLPVQAQDAATLVDPLREERQQQALEERTNSLGSFEAGAALPDPGPPQEAGGPCFEIDRLELSGVTALPTGLTDRITRGAVPACMDGAAIQRVMRQIDAAYASRGHITSKTYIPPQNLASRVLLLEVVEGVVEDIFLLDEGGQVETPRGARQLATAFPGAKGSLFQLRDFEQGLDQMNRLKSVDARLRLQPGDIEGGSYVLVERLQQDRFRGWLRWDNMASDGTGARRLGLDIEIDDLIGANDNFTFGYKGTVNTNALTVAGYIPYGYWTFSGDIGYSEYLTPLNEITELFGSTRSAGFGGRYLVKRDQNSTTELSMRLSLDRSYRWINGVRLTPQKLTTLSLGGTHMRLSEEARDFWDAGLVLGLPFFGGDDVPSSAGRDVPKAGFAKLTFGWQRQAGLAQLGTWVSDLRGQVSLQHLYSSERLALGSYSTVRGYELVEASGDSGLYLRNDLYLSKQLTDPLMSGSWLEQKGATLQPYLFADLGIAHDQALAETTAAAGIGLGASIYAGRLTTSALLGLPLLRDRKLDPGDPVLQVRMDVKAW